MSMDGGVGTIDQERVELAVILYVRLLRNGYPCRLEDVLALLRGERQRTSAVEASGSTSQGYYQAA